MITVTIEEPELSGNSHAIALIGEIPEKSRLQCDHSV
jgi:hypothetical protein